MLPRPWSLARGAPASSTCTRRRRGPSEGGAPRERASDGAARIAPTGAPLLLAPPYRHLHLAACASLAGARALLEPLAKGVVTVGSDDPAAARELAPAWARLAPLGAMQRPPLDGPVDLRNGD